MVMRADVCEDLGQQREPLRAPHSSPIIISWRSLQLLLGCIFSQPRIAAEKIQRNACFLVEVVMVCAYCD
jgi:hypothetical protein